MADFYKGKLHNQTLAMESVGIFLFKFNKKR